MGRQYRQPCRFTLQHSPVVRGSKGLDCESSEGRGRIFISNFCCGNKTGLFSFGTSRLRSFQRTNKSAVGSTQCGRDRWRTRDHFHFFAASSNYNSLPAEDSRLTMVALRHDTGFVVPERLLRTVNDIPKFLASRACKSLVEFIQALNMATRGAKLSDECTVSPLVQHILDTLNTMEGWCEEYPPSQQQMRYGNVAFREWHSRLMSSAAGETSIETLDNSLRLTNTSHFDFFLRRLGENDPS